MRFFLLGWLLSVALCLTVRAQPALLTERRNTKPFRPFSYNLKSFELPGQRFVHCGYTILTTKRELTLVVSTAAGDTVRYCRLNRNPPQGNDLFTDAALNPDYSLTYLSQRSTPITGGSTLDFSLTQLDTLGQVRWQRFFPLYPASTILSANSLMRVPDGYLVTLSFYSPASTGSLVYPQAGLAKLDLQGNLVWQRTWPGRGYGGVSYVNGLVPCSDGSYLAAGYTDNGTPYTGGAALPRFDHYLVQFTPQGDTIRTVRFGTNNVFDGSNKLALTRDGGVVVNGVSRVSSPSYNDAQVVKLDSLLRIQWTYTQPNTTNDGEQFYFVQPTTRGDILIGGGIYEAPTRRVYATINSFRPNGLVRWSYQHNFANDLMRPTNFNTLLCQPDSSAYLAGNTRATYSSTAYEDAYFRLGNVGAPFVPVLCRTSPVPNAGFALNPARDSLTLADFSTGGPRYAVVSRWRWQLPGGRVSESPTPPVQHFAPVPPAGTPVVLTITNNLGCTATQTLYPWGLPTARQQARELADKLTLYPNPASGTATLRLPEVAGQPATTVQVLDALGRVVVPAQLLRWAGTTGRAELDVATLPAGVYAVQVQAGAARFSKRLVVAPR